MKYIRRANERGRVDLGWLQSNHSFSFGHYYDPKHMGVSELRVINEDRVAGGTGFDTHGHRDMEIISVVLSGALKHKDSRGNEFVVKAGDVQRMSAGSGIMHSEYNASQSEEAHFLQIWIQPKFRGITPSYEQMTIAQTGALTPLVTPNGKGDTLSINQDATLSRVVLEQGQQLDIGVASGTGYFHIISGSVYTEQGDFQSGDAFATDAEERVTLHATDHLVALWFELPS
ncbi:pirin family protein [Pseudoalteromonas sp. SSDWG2]|uniref:pirin family protein n=1 Tax=Pseudoalteromonas sp. SSDWG2 TaxID=3139391 RepID=UPI003BAC7825